MHVTVRDLLNIEKLQSFEVIAGSKGLIRPINKVAILDSEFQRGSSTRPVKDCWEAGDFIVTSFQFAKDSPALIYSCVKRLIALEISGIAIKNVFSLEISKDLLRLADENGFPVVLATDHALSFEDIVIEANDLIRSVRDYNLAEHKVNHILKCNPDRGEIKNLSLAINYTFMNSLFCAYFSLRDRKGLHRLHALLSAEARRVKGISGSSLVKYQDGFFYIFTTNQPKEVNRVDIVDKLCHRLGLLKKDYYVGISDMHYHLYDMRCALLQSLYAAVYCRAMGEGQCEYGDLGIYRFIFLSIQNQEALDYCGKFIDPVMEHDLTGKTKLLDFILLYEQHRGNRQELAACLRTHENTVKYRINKTKKLLGFEESDPTFEEQLFLAVKVYRIRSVLNHELPD